ncbi:MAG: FAD-dependent oxidoreductase [Acidobacteria bacterium]|nr:FAD-dependent oxidoreductase [Acidobacteriota bacterium]
MSSGRFDVDVVVVGAGAMGAASAWRLARSGRSVLLLEQFGPGHTRGSSHGATRIFRLAYRDPRYVTFAAQALPLWRELEDAAGETLLEQVGQLDHGRPEAVAEVVAALRAAARPVEELRPDEAAERWPGFRFEGAVAHSPDGGRCWADRTVAAAQRLAVDAGTEVRFDSPVERIEVTGSAAVVHVAGGSWRTPVVVVAAGAWLPRLLGGVVDLPEVRIEADQPSQFDRLDPVGDWPSFLHHGEPVDGVDRPLHFDAYGLETPGEGVKVGGHGTVGPADPDDPARCPDPDRTLALVRYVSEWLPGLDPTPRSTTSCLFTTTPDEHFVLDRRGPVVVCSPCSGHGFKFVPAVAAEVERLVTSGGRPATHWRLPG